MMLALSLVESLSLLGGLLLAGGLLWLLLRPLRIDMRITHSHAPSDRENTIQDDQEE